MWTIQSASSRSKATFPDEEIRPTTQCHHIRVLQQGCPRSDLAIRYAQFQSTPMEQAQVNCCVNTSRLQQTLRYVMATNPGLFKRDIGCQQTYL